VLQRWRRGGRAPIILSVTPRRGVYSQGWAQKKTWAPAQVRAGPITNIGRRGTSLIEWPLWLEGDRFEHGEK